MNLTQVALADFLCTGNCTLASADPLAFHASSSTVEPFVGAAVRTLGQGFVLRRLSSDPGDAAITSNGVLLAFYFGELLAVDPAYAGPKLSVPLVLFAAPNRPLPSKRSVSPAGLAALTRAWKVANGQLTDPWP
jgi:hypothetical protein